MLLVLAALAAPAGSAWAGESRDSLIAEGARLMAGQAWADLLAGNTLKGRGWATYYAPDGRKVSTYKGWRVERRWWMDDAGRFCQTRAVDGAETCEADIYRVGDRFVVFADDGSPRAWFRLVDGNPENL